MVWSSDAILTALAAIPDSECVQYDRLAEITGLQTRTLQNATQALIKHKFIIRTSRGCHKITATGREAVNAQQPVRPGKHVPNPLRQAAWDVMRMMQKFTLTEVCVAAKEGGERDIESALGKYLRALEQAAYLQRLPIKGANGALRYRLVSNSGLQAPVWDAINKVVRDPNTNEVRSCG